MSRVSQVCQRWNTGQDSRWERFETALGKSGPGRVPVSQRTLALLTIAAQHGSMWTIFGSNGGQALKEAVAEATAYLDTPVELVVLTIADEYDTWAADFEQAKEDDLAQDRQEWGNLAQ